MKEVTIGGHVYKLDTYGHEAETYISDESYDVIPGMEAKVKMGTLKDLVVFFSLADWDVKDEHGGKIIISPKFDSEGRVMTGMLRNYRKYLPKRVVDELFVAASRLNRMSDEEKKTLQPASADGSSSQ